MSIAVTPGTGATIATDTISAQEHTLVKLEYGAAGSATQVSSSNGMPIQGITAASSSVAWTSATTINTANSISIGGMNAVSVTLVPTTTFTAGVLSFEVSADNGTNWVPIAMARIDTYNSESTYTIVASTNRGWTTSVDGFTNFRVRLSTAISGTGTATVIIIPQAFAIEPMVTVGQATAANLQATVTPGSTVGSAAPSAAYYLGAQDGNGNLQPLYLGNKFSDADTGGHSLEVMGRVYNGTSFDRQRAATIAANTTGTGVPAAGVLGFDGTNYQRLKTTITGQLAGIGISTTGGATTFTLISAATTNATSVKASAGTIYGIQASNTGAAVAFLKIFNLATAPTVGTSVAAKTLIIPAGGGITVPIGPTGLAFGTGISISITGVATTADTTAVALAQVVANIDYA